GMGKSLLVQHFVQSFGSSAVVLTGRCYEQESVPFKGVDSIVDALSEHLLQLSDDDVRSVLRGGVRYLASVFPVLNRVPLVAAAPSNTRAVADPLALRVQAYGEFERLVGALAEQKPLIVFLDDLQWADKDSLRLLGHTLLQPDPPACLFVLAMRSD